MGKKFFLFRRSDPVGSAKRFSESGLDIPILGVPADQIAFMTAGKGQINITFNGAGMYEGNEMFVGDSLEKTNVTISCEEGKEMKLIESIMGFVSKDDGRTIMKFDVLNNNASFGEVIVETVRDINSKIKSQPTERISQKISTGDAGSRFRNIIGGINFGSRTNKPFLDYNHELLTGADDTTLTLWRNSGTGSYTIYFAIGDPGVGTNSFGALFGDDDGETLGFSKEGYGSLFTMRHDGLDGKPFEASTDTDENGSVRYNFPDKTRTTEIGSRQFCYAFVIRRDKDFNVYLHNHEGEIVAFVPAFTEKSTSKTTTKIKSKPTEKSKGIYETKSTPITSKITAGATGRTDGNLFLQRLGTAGTNITSSFSGTLARFGVIKRDIGDGGASQLAKDLYKLYKPIL